MTPEPTLIQAPASAAVLEIIQGLSQELQPQRRAHAVSLDSSLERDLGFDSLGRVELLARLERAFGVRLPEELLGAAETPRDLFQALAGARPAAAPGEGFGTIEPLGGGEAAPD
ncbi:MAG TPA: acyl carrier protein, partial [Thermoanaerobaculia bacterium]